jgi:hypothetical protein
MGCIIFRKHLKGAAGVVATGFTLAASIHLFGETWATEGSGPTPKLTKCWAIDQVEISEYEIHWQDSLGAWQSPNRANNLRFTYLNDGFVAQRRVQNSEDDFWLIGLRVVGYGKGENLRAPNKRQVQVEKRSARTEVDDLVFEYTNDCSGMRQNFVIGSAPPGPGMLRVRIDAELQGVDMSVDGDQNVVAFGSSAGEVMRYGDLKVWDATGRRLSACFEPVGPWQFAITVDDDGAQFPITVDPLSFYWDYTGGQGSAKVGYAVALGDFAHLGGAGDIVVAAPYYDNGQTDEGKVFVFYGTTQPTTTTTPSWTAEIDYASANLGFSIAVGDVNGDDYDDLIVGAPGGVGGYSGYGNAYAWHGGAGGLNGGVNGNASNAKWTAYGFTLSGKFGYSVATSDFDGDGYADVLVGAPYDGNGKARVYRGGSTGISSSSSWSATLSNTGARFGYSVASAKVNGSAAIVVGALLYDDGRTDEGGVFVWHGLPASNGTEANCDSKIEINQAGAQFGFSLGKTDITADGYEDLIVGAPYYDNGETDEGGAFVYYGSSTGLGSNPSATWSAESNQANARFGWSVAGGNLNSIDDVYGDVAIGAPYYDYVLITDGGGTFVWYGSSSGLGVNGTPANADFSAFNQTSDTAHSGWSVAIGSNISYANHAGLIIGSPDEDGNGLTDRGSANAWSE